MRVCLNSLNGQIDSDANTFHSSNKIRIFELADGAIMYINIGGDDATKFYVVIFFDINGKQKPNVTGKDLFCIIGFFRNSNLVYFYTLNNQKDRNDYLSTCNRSAGTIASRTCGALIQTDGWEIKDDYPW